MHIREGEILIFIVSSWSGPVPAGGSPAVGRTGGADRSAGEEAAGRDLSYGVRRSPRQRMRAISRSSATAEMIRPPITTSW